MTRPFSVETFNRQSLDRLEHSLPGHDVLSAVLNVNPGLEMNQGSSLKVRAINALKRAGAPAPLLRVVVDDLPYAQLEGARTRAYFLWDEHGHTRGRALEVPLDLPDGVRFGPPDISALEFALEARPRTVVALVDHEWGRIFELQLGQITELVRFENVLDGNRFIERELTGGVAQPDRENTDPHRDSGRAVLQRNRDNNRLEYKLEDQNRRFLKAVSDGLERVWNAHHFERLIVAGTVESLPEFRIHLAPDLSRREVGEFHCPGDAPVPHVLELARPSLEQAEAEFESDLIRRAKDDGVRGTVETLEAVQQGRVYHLLVPFDGSQLRVWRDTGPNTYIFGQYPAQGQSPISGQGLEGLNLRDVLPSLRDLYGLKVSLLEGEPARILEHEMGGLAGLLRH